MRPRNLDAVPRGLQVQLSAVVERGRPGQDRVGLHYLRRVVERDIERPRRRRVVQLMEHHVIERRVCHADAVQRAAQHPRRGCRGRGRVAAAHALDFRVQIVDQHRQIKRVEVDVLVLVGARVVRRGQGGRCNIVAVPRDAEVVEQVVVRQVLHVEQSRHAPVEVVIDVQEPVLTRARQHHQRSRLPLAVLRQPRDVVPRAGRQRVESPRRCNGRVHLVRRAGREERIGAHEDLGVMRARRCRRQHDFHALVGRRPACCAPPRVGLRDLLHDRIERYRRGRRRDRRRSRPAQVDLRVGDVDQASVVVDRDREDVRRVRAGEWHLDSRPLAGGVERARRRDGRIDRHRDAHYVAEPERRRRHHVHGEAVGRHIRETRLRVRHVRAGG